MHEAQMGVGSNAFYLDDFLMLDSAVLDASLDFHDAFELGNIYEIERFFTEQHKDTRSSQQLHPLHNDLYHDPPIHSDLMVDDLPDSTDIYKPVRIRGIGMLREGYCEICKTWLRLKTSSYWYHMNYKHGINSRGVKYPEPQIRSVGCRTESFCTVCDKWIALGSSKHGKSAKFGWFKHCQKVHK
ncbi:hypothetical protein HK407_03g05740 [Ordospora pajunii]|uniref:uncharacterized protein n=1 Tax=Ordospora pajunii TaxID=3039483 RepID=UPI0029528F90|nr:uncharacterized protein HK407_03g05740 [Ordospora pajunii]KAH9411823.1 hypothetical protein HK407_03g05740 [Ordospora pajunii]